MRLLRRQQLDILLVNSNRTLNSAYVLIHDRQERPLGAFHRRCNGFPAGVGIEIATLIAQCRPTSGSQMLERIIDLQDELDLDYADPSPEELSCSFVYSITPAYPETIFSAAAPGYKPLYSGSVLDFDAEAATRICFPKFNVPRGSSLMPVASWLDSFGHLPQRKVSA